jgi:AraC-like DNA-binding protein
MIRVPYSGLSISPSALTTMTAIRIDDTTPEVTMLRTLADAATGAEVHGRIARFALIGAALVDSLVCALVGERPRDGSALLVERMKAFVIDNLAHPSLSPLAIATRFDVSTRYVALLFARAGLPAPAAFIRERRVELAKRYLAAGGLTVEDVAVRVGFSCAATMSRAFTRSVGRSPAQWRSQDEAA